MTQPLRVLCFTIGPEDEPSSRFRVYQWVEPLRREGIELEVRPLASRRYFEMGYGLRRLPAPLRLLWVSAHFVTRLLRRARDLWTARGYDLLLLQKELLPFGLGALATRLGLRVVYDFDDAVHVASELPEGQGRTLRRLAAALLQRERALPQLLARCELVLAGSPLLAEYARGFAERVALLPTAVDATAYRRAPLRRDGIPTLGWFGAPPNRVHLEMLRPVLQELARRREFQLRVHGLEHFDCPGVRVDCVGWRRFRDVAEEVEALHGFDVGLMPLRETPHARGKCALKAIQYMACGIPVVASPVGVTAEAVGAAGLLAESPQQWLDALERLLADPELRARLGAAGRERAAAHYSIAALAPRFAWLLREASRTRVDREASDSRARPKAAGRGRPARSGKPLPWARFSRQGRIAGGS